MTTPEFRMPSVSMNIQRYAQIPLSSPRTGAIVPGPQCQLHGGLPRFCASPSTLCQGSKCYGPSGRSTRGWHACLHGDQYINVVPGPDGRRFTVDRRRADRRTPGQPVSLDQLDQRILVNWAEDLLLTLANQMSVAVFLALNGARPSGKFEIPEFEVVETCGVDIGGLAFIGRKIEISSWMLHSRAEAEGVLRHELAHILVWRYNLQQPDSHGVNFTRALQAIAPLTWMRDYALHGTPEINQARSLIHPGARPLPLYGTVAINYPV